MSQTLTASPAARGDKSPPDGQPARRSPLRRFLIRPEAGSLLGAVAVFALFYALAPSFRQVESFSTILYQSSTLGIVAVGVALLMIGGEFDLSAGVGVIASALFASMLAYEFSANVWVGVALALVFSLSVGFVNGWLLVKTKLPSFLVTLSTFLMLQGLNVALTKLISGGVSTKNISNMDGFDLASAVFAHTFVVGDVRVKITVLWWLLLVAVATWVLLRSRVGNWIYAVGGDAQAARAVGVPVKRVKIGLFMTVGFTAWIAGMHMLFEFGTVQSGEGVGRELLYIMAAVVGGCLLTGGFGTAVGSAIGALIYGMSRQGIVYAGWDNNWLMFFVGAMLLLATVINISVKRHASKR
ncbi:MAG: ABC transporter permease [Stackebrandtia sp.]